MSKEIAVQMTPVVVQGVPVQSVMDRGVEWTGGISGLYVAQRLELLEVMTGCETKNRYHIVQIPGGTQIPVAPDGTFNTQWREQSHVQALLKAKEESECFERVCCPLFRSFTMDFKDQQGTNFFTINRPFKCDPCYAPPVCSCTTQELSIMDKNGSLVAKAEEQGGCAQGCCTRTFFITGADGHEMYRMEAPECFYKSGGGGCNVCAPTCFKEAYVIDVYSNGQLLENDASAFVWPGCNCGGLTDRSNFVINFPDNAAPEERAGLIAGMMLIEYAVNEKKQQDNKNNNGGGGGAPARQEMAR